MSGWEKCSNLLNHSFFSLFDLGPLLECSGFTSGSAPKEHFWLCLGEPYGRPGIKPRMAMCKSSTLLTVVMWSQSRTGQWHNYVPINYAPLTASLFSQQFLSRDFLCLLISQVSRGSCTCLTPRKTKVSVQSTTWIPLQPQIYSTRVYLPARCLRVALRSPMPNKLSFSSILPSLWLSTL